MGSDVDHRAAALEAISHLDGSLEAIVTLANKTRTRIQRVTQAIERGDDAKVEEATAEEQALFQALGEIGKLLDADGARVRRRVARLMRTENKSLEEIAEIFGVSRQRISMLLREEEAIEEAAGEDELPV